MNLHVQCVAASRALTLALFVCVFGMLRSRVAIGQASHAVGTPQPPAAPTHMKECYDYAARMNSTISRLDQAIREADDADAQRCRDAIDDPLPEMTRICRSVSVNCAPYGEESSLPSAASYQAEQCQAVNEKQTRLQACIQQVREWQSRHADQGSRQGIFALSAESPVQEGGGVLPDFLTHASSSMGSGIAEWGSKAMQVKQYYDVAQSLLKLSSPTLSRQDRSNLMQSLGLTAAQSIPNVNPISSVLMEVGVNVLNGIYQKDMQTLQSELSAFDSSLPAAADPSELNMRPLYAEATPAGYRDVANVVSQLKGMFSPDSSTYVGSEVSWSTRMQQNAPAPTYGSTAPPPAQYPAPSQAICPPGQFPIYDADTGKVIECNGSCVSGYHNPACPGQ